MKLREFGEYKEFDNEKSVISLFIKRAISVYWLRLLMVVVALVFIVEEELQLLKNTTLSIVNSFSEFFDKASSILSSKCNLFVNVVYIKLQRKINTNNKTITRKIKASFFIFSFMITSHDNIIQKIILSK